jgi:hypothetical protein
MTTRYARLSGCRCMRGPARLHVRWWTPGVRLPPPATPGRRKSAARSGMRVWAARGTMLAALLHLAMPFGGPSWYTFLRAPDVIVRMAGAGHPYPAFMCLVIATLLVLCTLYAVSGAGIILRLPWLRTGLTVIAAGFLARGLSFIPLIALRPDALAGVCHCTKVDTFIVVSSAVCLAIGAGYAAGAARLWRTAGTVH